MFIIPKSDSLSVVMVVRKDPLTSFKVLFARSLSAEVSGIVLISYPDLPRPRRSGYEISIVQAIRSTVNVREHDLVEKRDKDYRYQFQ